MSVCVPPPAAGLAPLTVKAATTLQLGLCLRAQRTARAKYVAWALAMGAVSPSAGEVSAATKSLLTGMEQLWKIEWYNERREALWRVSVNGVRGAGGRDIVFPGPCRCGWAGPPAGVSAEADRRRRAHRWRYTIFGSAQLLRRFARSYGMAWGRRNPSCADVWLLRPPLGVCLGF